MRTVLIGPPVAVDLDLPLEDEVRAVGNVPLELGPATEFRTGWLRGTTYSYGWEEETADGGGGEGRTGRCT